VTLFSISEVKCRFTWLVIDPGSAIGTTVPAAVLAVFGCVIIINLRRVDGEFKGALWNTDQAEFQPPLGS